MSEETPGEAPKTIEESFTDWESHVFGFGYGTGEEFIIPALKQFFATFADDKTYDHVKLSDVLDPTTAWLLINALCKANVLEYGTSPRFGWLTDKGRRLRDFIASKSSEDLYELTCRSEEYVSCSPDTCNCGPEGYVAGRKCPNPFW